MIVTSLFVKVFPAIPNPPSITKAPFVYAEEAVVALIFTVPAAAAKLIVVAAPPMLTVLAVALNKVPAAADVVISPPFTAKSPVISTPVGLYSAIMVAEELLVILKLLSLPLNKLHVLASVP